MGRHRDIYDFLSAREGGDCKIASCGSQNSLVAAIAAGMLTELNNFSVNIKPEVLMPSINFSGAAPDEITR